MLAAGTIEERKRLIRWTKIIILQKFFKYIDHYIDQTVDRNFEQYGKCLSKHIMYHVQNLKIPNRILTVSAMFLFYILFLIL